MSYPQLSVLLPAAGASKRLGQPKQLVRYKAETLIQNAINLAQSIGPREIIVITGANAQAVKDAVPQTTVRWVHNPHWSAGMGRSIATGAACISPESSGVMILLCDQWRLETADLRTLAETWKSQPGRIVCAQAEGQNMPPAIFPASIFDLLQTLSGERGARSILENNPERVTAVVLKNAAYDLDFKSQLDQLTRIT